MRLAALALTFVAAFAQEKPNAPGQQAKPYVLLVGLDGFRFDFAERYNVTPLLDLAKRGVAADKLIPAYPSVTFPNFYTLVTGLTPAAHGLVSMNFFDPVRNDHFDYRGPAGRDGSWFGGTPVWVLAERQGMRTASYFWVGSDTEIQGVRPTSYVAYNATATHEDRVKQVVEWFALPADRRPHLVTLYFSDVDGAGHRFGPDSPEIEAAVHKVKETLADLFAKLREVRPDLNVIVVSDHGVDTVRNTIDLGKDTDYPGMRVVNNQNQILLYEQEPGSAEKARTRMLGLGEGFKVYRRSEVPSHLSYSGNPRTGDLLVLPEGRDWVRISITGQESRPAPKGWHGWDPATVPNMQAIFYAAGPHICGGRIATANSTAVFGLLVGLLDLEPPPGQKIDGTLAAIRKRNGVCGGQR